MKKTTPMAGPGKRQPAGEKTIYQTLFESVGFAAIIADDTGTISHVNPSFEQLSGYSRDELVGRKKWVDFLINGDLAIMREYHSFTNTCTREASRNHDFKFITKDGHSRDVCVAKNSMGTTGKTVISFIDITEVVDGKEKTKLSEAKYRSLIESTDDSIYMMDKDCRYLFVNERMLSRLNVSEEEIIGKQYGDFHQADDTREFSGYIGKVFETGTSYRYEYKNRKTERYTIRTLSPIMDRYSRLVRFVGIVSKDITELKKTEAKLKYLSLHDSLTGLYNRAYFEEEMYRHDNSRFESVGLIVCDIDGLKLINDTLGHDKGDELIMAASRVIKASFREGDVVARVGGDEFAILLPNTEKSQVEEISARIKEAVKDGNREGSLLPLSIAVGYAARSNTSQSMAELYREADNSMYKQKLYSSQNARNAIVRNLISTVEAKGVVRHQALEHLQELVVRLARTIGMSEDRVKDLSLLVRFHDIGNISVHDQILSKPGGLTDNEIAEIRKHCDVGHRIAQAAPDLIYISDYILKHHEWWDGRGYPLGLRGEEIPLESRIMAIADAYEAMIYGRPHKKALTKRSALAELVRNAGTQFDPALVETFVKMARAKAL